MLFRSSTTSSITKVIADRGVLNAAARPAAAPDNNAALRPCLATPSIPAIFDANAPDDLDGRSLAAKAASAADRDHSREKFSEYDLEGYVPEISPERDLELWDAAARRVPANECQNKARHERCPEYREDADQNKTPGRDG